MEKDHAESISSQPTNRYSASGPLARGSFRRRHLLGKVAVAMACLMLGAISRGEEGTVTSSAGIQLFEHHYMQRADRETVPARGEELAKLAVHAAQGEYEPATFLIRSSRSLRGVSVALQGDLRRTNGNRTVIPADRVDIRLVAGMKRKTGEDRCEWTPIYLRKRRRFDLKPEETERIWVTVNVPQDAPPGLYSTDLLIRTGSSTLGNIPYEVRVWPFRLKEIHPDEMTYFIFFRPWKIRDEQRRNVRFLAACYRDMRAHGMNSVTAYVRPAKGDTMTSGKFPTLGDTLAALRESRLLRKGGKFLWMEPAGFPADTVRQVTDAVNKASMEMVFYTVDEPGLNKRFPDARKHVARLKEICPDVRVTTAFISLRGMQEVADLYDVWIPHNCVGLSEAWMAKAAEGERTVWSYDCSLAPVDPWTTRHFFGLRLWRIGASGASLWCYYDGRPDYAGPLEKTYDFVFADPEEGLLPSIGWEGVREGIDDYRYMATLQDLISRAAKAGGDTGPAENLLRRIRDAIPTDYRKVYMEAIRRNKRGRRYAHMFDRGPPVPGLTPEDYDQFRQAVAGQIIALSKFVPKMR